MRARSLFLKLCLCGLLWLSAARPGSAENYALLIGVETYEHADVIRPFAAADADADNLGKALVDVANFPAANVHVFTSKSQEKPTVGRILSELVELADKTKPGDLVFIFFAGHGIERDGEPALLPYDADPSTEARYKDSVLATATFREQTRKISCKALILAFDICRGIPMEKGWAPRGYNLLSANQARCVLPVENAAFGDNSTGPRSTVACYACAPDNESYAWKAKERGYFSYYLEQGLRSTQEGGAADQQGVVKVQYLLDYVSKAVAGAVDRDNFHGHATYVVKDTDEALPIVLAVGRTPQSAGVSAVPVVVGSGVKERFDMAFQRGMELYDEKHYDAALPKLREALSQNPKSMATLIYLAAIAMKKHDDPGAEVLCRRALDIEPQNVDLLFELAIICGTEGKKEEAKAALKQAMALDPNAAFPATALPDPVPFSSPEAEKICRRAIVLDPNSALLIYTLGNIYDKRKDYVEAEKLYRKAIKMDPTGSDAVLGLTTIYTDIKKDYAAAESIYRKAITASPQEPRYLIDLGDILMEHTKKYGEVEKLYRRAMELDPNDPIPVVDLATLYVNTNRNSEESESLYRRALQLGPRDASILTGFANLMLQRSRYPEAEKLYRQAMAINTTYASPVDGLAIVYRDGKKDYVTAERLFRKAIRLDPGDASPVTGLGDLYYTKRNYRQAEQLFRRAMAMSPTNPAPVISLAVLFRDRGVSQQAERLFRKALVFDPTNMDAVKGLAALFFDRKDWARADQMYRKALDINPTDEESLVYLGDVSTWRDNYIDAMQFYRQAMRLDPTDAKAAYGLADALWSYDPETDDLKEASRLYRKAIALKFSGGEIHAKLADCLLDLNQRNDALVEAKKAIKLGFKGPCDAYKAFKLKH